jgi:hypothetical protein
LRENAPVDNSPVMHRLELACPRRSTPALSRRSSCARRPRRVAASLLAVALVPGLVACGDDSGDPLVSGGTAITSASASASGSTGGDASTTGDGSASAGSTGDGGSTTANATTDVPTTGDVSDTADTADTTGATTDDSGTSTTTTGDEPPVIDDCVLIVDDLSDGASDAAVVDGGEFVAGGWRPLANKNHLRYDLADPVVDGGAQLWITGFDPPGQATADKHHFFAGRSTANEGEGGDWWRWRSGQNYGGGVEGTMKVLTALDPLDQVEARILGDVVYDLAKTYRFKAIWRVGGEVEFYFEDQLIWDAKWDAPITTNFIFLARDGYHGYPTAVGATYVRLVAWSGEEPADLDNVSVGCE